MAGGYTNIAGQIIAKGWIALTGVTGVYYKEYTQGDTPDLVVFEKFKVSDTANTVAGWSNINKDTTKVTVKAYAIQKDSFTTAEAAWAAGNFQ